MIVFCDFDGTITLQDSGCILVDACMGEQKRKELDRMVLEGKLSYREAVTQMWRSVDLSWEEATQLLKKVELDSGFMEFHDYCQSISVPITILSAGLDVVVRHVLPLSLDRLKLIANSVSSQGDWKIQFVHDNSHGHDKALSIQRQLDDKHAKTLFVGDGVSDICVVGKVDYLFARKNSSLERYCIQHNISHITFDTFLDVMEFIKAHI